jgi:hypothetical protein
MTVDLEEPACSLALGPHSQGLLLRPETRAAIERAPKSPIGMPFRTVTCTHVEALDLLHYFRSTADVLTVLGDARAAVCARAFDNTRRALQVAGIRI